MGMQGAAEMSHVAHPETQKSPPYASSSGAGVESAIIYASNVRERTASAP